MSDNAVVESAQTLPTDMSETNKFVTMRLDGQLFGLPIDSVQDVLRPQSITNVPLSGTEVAGLINLRGIIVTVIDMRAKMGLPPKDLKKYMEIVVKYNDEPYSLIVDSVDEVMDLPNSRYENTPDNLSEQWKNLSTGVYRLKEEIMVLIDISSLFQGIVD